MNDLPDSHDTLHDALPHDERRARRPQTDAKLRRSRHDRVLTGVLGGIAEFVGGEPQGRADYLFGGDLFFRWDFGDWVHFALVVDATRGCVDCVKFFSLYTLSMIFRCRMYRVVPEKLEAFNTFFLDPSFAGTATLRR